MSIDSVSTANYAAVINDLRAKRDALTRTIELLESLAQVPAPALIPTPAPQEATPRRPVFPLGKLAGASIGEACVQVLRESQFPMSTREVTDKLVKEGYQINSREPVNNVSSALYHRSKTSGDVTRSGKQWRFVGQTVEVCEKGIEAAIAQGANEMNGAEAHY